MTQRALSSSDLVSKDTTVTVIIPERDGQHNTNLSTSNNSSEIEKIEDLTPTPSLVSAPIDKTKTANDPLPPTTFINKLRGHMTPMLLYVVSIAQFLDIVNGASVSIAIIPIAQDLNFTVSEIIWILNAYTIAFAGLLLVSGRLGDLFGHRRMFLAGISWFGTWALVASFSKSPLMFIIARALQGMGAANTIPTAMALIAINFPPGPERTKALSIFAAFGGMGAVVGVLMAGGIIASIGWPWIFRVSALAAYLLFCLGCLAIPVIPPKMGIQKPKVDFIGAFTVTLGVTGTVYYICTGVEKGWASPKTLPVLFAGLILLFLFVFAESKVDSPLMPLRIWKSKSFATSVALAFVSMAMWQGIIYYVNMFFQEVYGWDAMQTALGFLCHGILAIIAFTTLGRIMPRLSLKPLIMTGFFLRCVATLMFAFMNENTKYWHIPFPALVIHVFGAGFSLLPIQITAVRDADNKDQGLVGAIYNTGLQMGAPFGVAILNVISISTNGNADSAVVRGGESLVKGYRNAFFGIAVYGAVGFFLTWVFLPWDTPSRPFKIKTKTSKSADPPTTDGTIEYKTTTNTTNADAASNTGTTIDDLEHGYAVEEKEEEEKHGDSKSESESSTVL